MSNLPVTSRAVFFVGGYDPKSPGAFFARLARETGKSAALWSAATRASPVAAAADGESARVTMETSGGTRGPEWACRTDFTFLVLDRLVLADFGRALPVRLVKYLVAFADFTASGTALRIFRHAWRFGLYFLFPFGCLLLFAGLAAALGGLAAQAGGSGWGGLGVAAAAFLVLVGVLGERWPVNHLMDLWSFSRDFLRGRRPDAEAQMDRFAALVAASVRERSYDEVLLVGHSTGGLLILDVAARCLALDPAFSQRAASVSLLTLGSTALKAGLHPAAWRFRQSVARLAADGALEWVEVQCLTDVINFHRTDPLKLMRLAPPANRAFPLVRSVRMRAMLDPQAYRRIRRSFFRVHYQYISGNTRPYFFDFFLICCGPLPLLRRMATANTGPFAGTSKAAASEPAA